MAGMFVLNHPDKNVSSFHICIITASTRSGAAQNRALDGEDYVMMRILLQVEFGRHRHFPRPKGAIGQRAAMSQ
jgi:hypothetical protein